MFLLCDSIEHKQMPCGEIQKLVSPQVVLRPMFIPGNFSFGVSIGVRGLKISEAIKLKFAVLAPDGNVVQESPETLIETDGVKDTLPEEHQGLMINIDIRNLVIQEEGVYKFVLTVNGEQLEPQDVPIYKGLQNV